MFVEYFACTLAFLLPWKCIISVETTKICGCGQELLPGSHLRWSTISGKSSLTHSWMSSRNVQFAIFRSWTRWYFVSHIRHDLFIEVPCSLRQKNFPTLLTEHSSFEDFIKPINISHDPDGARYRKELKHGTRMCLKQSGAWLSANLIRNSRFRCDPARVRIAVAE